MQTKAHQTKVMAQLKGIEAALWQYHIHHQRLPTDEEGLDVLIDAEGESEPLLRYGEQAITDPWGNRIRYQRNDSSGFTLGCDGPDRKPGTPDDMVVTRSR